MFWRSQGLFVALDCRHQHASLLAGYLQCLIVMKWLQEYEAVGQYLFQILANTSAQDHWISFGEQVKMGDKVWNTKWSFLWRSHTLHTEWPIGNTGEQEVLGIRRVLSVVKGRLVVHLLPKGNQWLKFIVSFPLGWSYPSERTIWKMHRLERAVESFLHPISFWPASLFFPGFFQ